MTLTLHLSPELEQRLKLEANRQSIPVDAFAVKLISQSLPPSERGTAVASLLQSWIQEADAEDQLETGAYLVQALDEDRVAERQLFPLSLKGVTW